MSALTITGLTKSFGSVQALAGVDLRVESGSFFGLLGPNGAGKSTLMSCVTGFLPSDSGRIELLGEPLQPENVRQRMRVGLSPQNIALYKELSAEQNLQLFGKICGLKGRELDERVGGALELAQLTDRRDSAVKEFSGGMMRRLNIAVALLQSPDILLCDEPTVGVDPQSRNAIFDTLKELNRNGLTVVYSTHYMEEAERLCDHIAIIDHGHILRCGDLDSLLGELPPVNRILARRSRVSTGIVEGMARFGAVGDDNDHVQLEPAEGFRLSEFYRWVEDAGVESRLFRVERPSLENLFLRLTGRELRE